MTDFAVIDIVLLVLLILLAIRGFIRGFVSEFFALGAPALGILAGFFFYKNGAEFLRARFFNDLKVIPEILAFIALFLIVYIVCKIVQKIICDVVSGMNLTTMDKVLGAIFGLVEGILAASLVLFIINRQPLFDPSKVLETSIFWKIFVQLIGETAGEAAKNTVFLFSHIYKQQV